MDFLDVFLAISMSDRRAPRRSRHAMALAGGDHRTFDVRIPVRNPERWRSPEVDEAIREVANLLNGAEWRFEFEPRLREPRRVELQRTLDLGSVLDGATVLLQSGGLDSLLGMAQSLAADDRARLIPVSVFTHSRSARLVRSVNNALRRVFPHASIEGSHLRLEHFRRSHAIDDRESAYRTRILPCLATGIAVAAEFADGRLRLTENGPGAINLPTSPEQLDTWTTRATHPLTLALVDRLATLILEREIRIENTGLFETKGELAMLLNDSRFHDAAGLTVSCERFPYVSGDSPCGTCTSCLYRAMALHRAGVAFIDGNAGFQADELGQRYGARVGQAALALFVQQMKRYLDSERPYDMLAAQYRRIDEVVAVADSLEMTDRAVRGSILRLYNAFVAEVDGLLGADLLEFRQPSLDRAVAS